MASRAHLKFSFAYWTWILTYIKESWVNILSLALVLFSNLSVGSLCKSVLTQLKLCQQNLMEGKCYLAGVSSRGVPKVHHPSGEGSRSSPGSSLQVFSECNSLSCKCTSFCAGFARPLFPGVFHWACDSGSSAVLWLLSARGEVLWARREAAWCVVVSLGSCVWLWFVTPLHVAAARSAANACLLWEPRHCVMWKQEWPGGPKDGEGGRG